tara:strand:+ start:1479 stop:2057 length:579 start_codon:yes stop_codon:yes gene_type:complete
VSEFLKKQKVSLCIIWFIFLGSCNTTYKPKPRGFNYISFPERNYENLYIKDVYFFQKNTLANHYLDPELPWVTIKYKKLKAEILITHKEIIKESDLSTFIEESYKLIGRHQIKAESILEKVVITSDKKQATIFEIKGSVASPYQFITTDSVKNFLRAALYLDMPIENDSIAPVINYLKDDVNQILNTLTWND